MSYPPVKLPDDPKEALSKIASYLRSVRNGRDRAHYESGELVGYWQTPEWIKGLEEISEEVERILPL